MGDKAKTLHAMRRLKLVDRIFRSVYCCHCVLPFIRDPVCIVGLVPNTLQNDECFREFLDFTRESLHCLNLLASVFCVSVFKCAVNLMPSRAAFSADEQVGGSVGQRVEHSIIRGADRAAQVGLRGLSRIKLRQAAGSRYQDRGFDSKHRLRDFDGVPVLASGLLTTFIVESQTTALKPFHWLSNKFSG